MKKGTVLKLEFKKNYIFNVTKGTSNKIAKRVLFLKGISCSVF